MKKIVYLSSNEKKYYIFQAMKKETFPRFKIHLTHFRHCLNISVWSSFLVTLLNPYRLDAGSAVRKIR